MVLGETGVLDFVAFTAITALVCFSYYISSKAFQAVWLQVAVDVTRTSRMKRQKKREAYGWLMSAVWMVYKWCLVVGYFFYVRRGNSDAVVGDSTSVDDAIWLSINLLTLIYLGLGYAYLRVLSSSSNIRMLKESKGSVMMAVGGLMVAVGLTLVALLIREVIDRADQAYYIMVMILYAVNVSIALGSYIYALARGLFRHISVANHAHQDILQHGYVYDSNGQYREITEGAINLSHAGQKGRYAVLVDRILTLNHKHKRHGQYP